MNAGFVAANGIARLFEPIAINTMVLPNRFIMPGMQRGWCVEGAPLPRLGEYYRERAAGGVSLIISESCAIDHPSATAQPTAAVMNTRTAPAWKATVDAIADVGGHFLVQLWHEGGMRDDADGRTVSPSGLSNPALRRGAAATHRDIDEIVASYVGSARRAQDCGADGIELHCAHGYLLDQFLWAGTNLRDDDYGGARLVDRATLPARILRDIRSACGDDFVISVRFSQWKIEDYSARIAETASEFEDFFRLLEDAGADMFHASARRFWEPAWSDSERSIAGWTRHLSGKPTAAVGSVGLDRDVMQSFAGDGEATGTVPETLVRLRHAVETDAFDLLAVGRSLIADPDWVSKLQRGAIDEIRPFRNSDLQT